MFCVLGIGWVVVSIIVSIKGNFLTASITFGIAIGHFAPVIVCVLKILNKDLREKKIKISF